MKKTIALYINSLQRGGAQRVIVNLARYFHGKGYRVILVTTKVAEPEYEVPEGVIRRISEPEDALLSGSRLSNFRMRFKTLRAIWKEEKPDVILSFIGKNNMMAILTACGLKMPVAVSVRGEPSEEYYSKALRFAARNLFRFAGLVILQTKRCFSFFPNGVRKKAVILKNPINESFFKERYEGEREKTVVAVGRVDENKNHAMLIDAFAEIAEEFPEYCLTIYGDGEKKEQLQAKVQQAGLDNRIFLSGNIDNIAETIYKARIFVLSSNTEGMPNTLIEAMMMGLAVISTDCPCGGPAELITHDVNGLLVPVGDKEKMKDSLRLFMSQPQKAEEMGIRAARIKDDYQPEKVYGEWQECLETLMNRKSR